MSKHRRRDNRYSDNRNMGYNNMNRYGNINNNPFGISPQQLLNLIGGNMNMNSLGNILSSMNTEGFDLNSMGSQMGFNDINNMNTQEGEFEAPTDFNEISKEDIDDENIEFLISLKKVINPSKVEFINKIIDLYKKGVFENN